MGVQVNVYLNGDILLDVTKFVMVADMSEAGVKQKKKDQPEII